MIPVPQVCEWSPSLLLTFSENVFSPLIYYSHLGPLILSLLLGTVVLFNNPRALINRVLFVVTGLFGLWVYLDLILWAHENPSVIMFAWAIIVPVELLIYAACLYLVGVFANGLNDTSWRVKAAIVAFFIPLFFGLHTSLNLIGFDFTNCDREAIEGPLISYLYYAELLLIGLITTVAIRGWRRLETRSARTQLTLVTLATLIFLLIFSAGNILVTQFLEFDWSYEQYKLFGMPIFAALIAYSIVKFRTFNVKVITAQILVVALGLLILSLLFLQSIENVRILTVITFALVCILGYVLVRSVRQEVEQREKIERLAKELESANTRLKELDKLKSEFVSIASHQLRSPLAAVKGYASMLLEGSFGRLSVGAHEAVGRIFSSSALMARSVEDFLNVSRIELGRMKYDLSEFDMCQLVDSVIEEQKPIAEDKKLKLKFFKDASITTCDVFADIGKIKQVLTNFVDNAIKYTQRGSVTVTFSRDTKRNVVRVGVTDTGIGMSQETIKKLFAKFARADNANKVNVIGTGLGLFVAKQLVEAHGGRVWAESPGDGKGSTFFFELPLQARGEAVEAATMDSAPPPQPAAA